MNIHSTARDGIVERTANGGVIRFERHLPHSIDHVWAAITEPARLADWWLPMDADITINLRAGGEMRFEIGGDEPMTMLCDIVTVDAPTLLEHTHVEPGSLMRWELESVADGTLLRLSHHVVDVSGAIGQCFVVGLHTSLDRLEPALAGAPIEWDWAGFAATQAHYAEAGLAPAVAER